jgi:hypothetical protein
MLLWERKIPDFLTDKRNIVSFILFTAVFALIFINIYSPFGVDKWMNVTDVQLFLYSSIVILIGMLVIVISRMLMYYVNRKNTINFGKYALWIVGEISVMAFVYALIQWFFLHVGDEFILVLKNSIRITAFIILLPYVIFWLYVSFKDKYSKLESIESGLSGGAPALMHENKITSSLTLIPFRDEKGMLKFSIKKEDLLYIEAADNYIFVYYIDHQKVVKYMVRTTLKRIEQELPNAGLVRSHRSFMVNIDNVKYIRKEREGLIISFEAPANITIPISRTYLDVFIRKLSGMSGLGEN